MKTNTIKRTGHRGLLVGGVIFLLVLLLTALVLASEKLKSLYLEQCIVRDFAKQVEIIPGRMVKAGTIAESFGLKVGANLGLIDFAEKRQRILDEIPNLKNIIVSRRLPDRVIIRVEEREPVARLIKSGERNSMRVADDEGVAFACAKRTRNLPAIREAKGAETRVGLKVGPRTRAALELLELVKGDAYSKITILDINLESPDFMLITLSTYNNYTTLRLSWDGMYEERTAASHASLVLQMEKVMQCLATNIATETQIWDATDFSEKGRVSARPRTR